MPETELSWKGRVEPTGTLFLDDLQELENLLRAADSKVTWSLEGKGSSGSIKVTAKTLGELVDLRNRVSEPERLELTVRDQRDRFSAYLETPTSWSSKGVAWEARITADYDQRERFERSTREIEEIFTSASRSTWAIRNKDFLDWAPPLALLATLFVLWRIWDVAVEVSLGLWPFTVPFTVGYLFVATGVYLFARRLKADASWDLPRFNLRQRRTDATEPVPPPILQRDVVLTTIVAAIGIVVTVVVAIFL